MARRLSLRIENDQPAQLELPCAHARIDRPLAIGERWRVRVEGPLLPGTSRPAREDEKNEGIDARIRGRVDDDRVTLNVIVDGKTIAGPITLDFGKPLAS